ncbi:hypothetical protein EI94DRAFT_1742402 [Lactarius quietus]|nr:hypothetical protein EI94DRAFT_1742402 [Lactarius quietus]
MSPILCLELLLWAWVGRTCRCCRRSCIRGCSSHRLALQGSANCRYGCHGCTMTNVNRDDVREAQIVPIGRREGKRRSKRCSAVSSSLRSKGGRYKQKKPLTARME